MELPKVPLGYRFRPTPDECIHYLTCKVTSKPLPCTGIILDLNPYDVKQLPDIFSSVEKRGEVYLFTQLSKKGRIGNINVNRKVGKGTWHGDQFGKVSDPRGTKVGVSRKLSYREKGSPYNISKFLMTEYSLLEDTPLQYSSLKDYVLCHITKNGRSRNTNNDSSSHCESIDSVPSTPSITTQEDVLSLAVATTTPITDYVLPDSQHYITLPAPHDELGELLMLLDNDISLLDESWESLFDFDRFDAKRIIGI